MRKDSASQTLDGEPIITGVHVLRLRNALRLRQQEFATLIHVGQVSVSRWETDRVVPESYSALVVQLMRRLPLRKIGPRVVVDALRVCNTRADVVTALVRLWIKHGGSEQEGDEETDAKSSAA